MTARIIHLGLRLAGLTAAALLVGCGGSEGQVTSSTHQQYSPGVHRRVLPRPRTAPRRPSRPRRCPTNTASESEIAAALQAAGVAKASRWARHLPADRIAAVLGVEEQARVMRSAPANSLGDVVYVTVLPADTVDWLTRRMDLDGDALTVALPIADALLWTATFESEMGMVTRTWASSTAASCSPRRRLSAKSCKLMPRRNTSGSEIRQPRIGPGESGYLQLQSTAARAPIRSAKDGRGHVDRPFLIDVDGRDLGGWLVGGYGSTARGVVWAQPDIA